MFVFSEDYLQYKFRDDHPFNQQRLLLTLDLLKHFGLISEKQVKAPRYASDAEIELVHDPQYIAAVKKLGRKGTDPALAESYGLGTEDTPVFANMHEAAALIVGGTLTGVEAVMEGKCEHAVNLAGGLHHALRGRASGFCIYNDCAVAIAFLRKHYDARVLYVDTDAHHGDGVQWAFYDDPNVLTISLHETGKYLFPGTGSVTERGEGAGYGYSVNIPLEAFTEDESWLYAYEKAVPPLARGFRPDVIVTQHGCDAHFLDPLTHLATSMRIYRRIPQLIHELSHELCAGRWIATGGGGYDIWRVVPRAWTLLWAEMAEHPLGDVPLPDSWREKWQKFSPVRLPERLLDAPQELPHIPRRAEISESNKRTVEKALLYAPKG
ncbi:acetoin utilization protein AcuC [Bacillaceae bacterium]